MHTWFEVLNLAAMVASVLSFFAGVYALWKKKPFTSVCFILLFFFTILGLLIAQRSHIEATVQGQPLQDGDSVAPKQSIPSQAAGTYTTTGSSTQLRDAGDRLKDLQVRAIETQKRWEPTVERLKRLDQPMRPNISDALTRLRSYIELAQKALAEKDSRSAMKSINLAEKQITFLEQQDPQ